MTQETNDSVSYLLALKQARGTNATSAAAPARAPDPTAAPHPDALEPKQYSGSEKRRNSRYHCEGSMEMRTEGTDIRTWVTFTDVSLNGCYVEAQATYPVGTVLQMKMEANGYRVVTKGTVRVTYPYLGMGIAFTDMTEGDHQHLRALLQTLSHPAAVMAPEIVAPEITAQQPASSLPPEDRSDSVPPISDASAAMHALVEFFNHRQVLVRDEFLRILRTTQHANPKPEI